MKCALELINLKAKAELEYEIEERRKDKKAYEVFEKMKENSISLCDNFINDELIKKAQNRKPLSIYIKVVYKKDRLNNLCMYFVEPDGNYYANGRKSYSANYKIGYAVNEFKKYLADNCITVDESESDFQHYGYGVRDAIELHIYVPNELK